MEVITTSYGRFYQVNGRWLPSVTTVLKYGFPPSPALIKWLKDQPNAEAADQVRDAAGQRGTETHEAIEKLLTTGMVSLEFLDPDIAKMVLGASRWIDDNVQEIISVELTLHNHLAAGRADCLVRLKSGDVALIDFKTSKSINESYHAQVAVYCQMWSTANQQPMPLGQIVHLKPGTKKGYQVIDVEIEPGLEAFTNAYGLACYVGMPLCPKAKEPLPVAIVLTIPIAPGIVNNTTEKE